MNCLAMKLLGGKKISFATVSQPAKVRAIYYNTSDGKIIELYHKDVCVRKNSIYYV